MESEDTVSKETRNQVTVNWPRLTGATALLLMLVGGLVALLLRPQFGESDRTAAESRSGAARADMLYQSPSYPGPSPTPVLPTPTPTPDAEGRYPPPGGVMHEVIALAESPHAPILLLLDDALMMGDSATLAEWIGGSEDTLTLEYYAEGEGFGTRPSADEVRSILDSLFAGNSSPAIQGYFEPGCMRGRGACGLFVILTGLRGQVAMPTADPNSELGLPAPADLPLGAAAWELFPDGGGVWWRAWWLGDGYYALVEDLYERGLGTYYVTR